MSDVRTIAANEVHVHCRPLDVLDADGIAQALSIISPDERARYDRFVFDHSRREFAAAHALLRTALSQYSDRAPSSWSFRNQSGGKPVLADEAPRLAFNLSHTRGLVACAITGGPAVGVDVESVDREISDGVTERFFSAREQAALRACPDDIRRRERFFEIWTLKEAFLKATGEGFSRPLPSVAFDVDGDGRIAFVPARDIDAACWHFALIVPVRGYRLAVAVHKATGAEPRIVATLG